MKNQIIKLLVLSISVALIGLISVQLYWIDNAVTLREDEFNKTVNSALHNVAGRLERMEMHNKVTSSKLGRQFITNRSQLIRDRIKQLEESYNITRSSDTIIRKDENGSAVKIISRSQGDSVNMIDKEVIIGKGENSFSSFYSMDVSVNGNRKTTTVRSGYDTVDVNGKLLSQTNMIYDIVSDLFRFNFAPKIEQRLSSELLDSLVADELNRSLIHTDYKLGVFDVYGRGMAAFTEKENLGALRGSLFKVKLFPNDISGEPYFLSVFFPNQKGFLLKTMSLMLILSVLFMIVVIAAFSYTIVSIVKQKKLSLIKNDFINNMTHELKTPISTISLACQALSDKDISATENQKEKFVKMIEQENKRLGLLVENVLKSSIWDTSDFKLEQEELAINTIVKQVTDNSLLQVQKSGGKLNLSLDESLSTIIGDKVHLTNIIYNLIDNAIKYSVDQPEIGVSTSGDEHGVVIRVTDNGRGISKDHQKKIFDKFYRVPTGNVHNVKGFGLGLNYVQAVVQKHHGKVTVESTVGQGSKFEIHIPINRKDEPNRTTA